MKYLSLVLVTVLTLLVSCAKDTDNTAIVRIGQKSYSQSQFDAFKSVVNNYPAYTQPTILPNRSSIISISHLVKYEVLSQKASRFYSSNEFKNSDNWKWQTKFYPAQFFMFEYLSSNMNISEDEIKNYYEANKESFKIEPDTATAAKDSTDSTSTVAPLAATYKNLPDVKNDIIETLFLQKYKPDSAFVAQFDSSADSTQIANQWLRYVNSNLPNFFMKQFYKEKFNQPYPDSISAILGEGKIIGQKDLDLILSWLPQEQRQTAMSDDGKRNLVEWLLKWQLMSEVAQKSGFTSSKVMKERMEWAYKLAIACKYLEEEVIAKVKNAPVDFDTSMIDYVIYDELGAPSSSITDSQRESKITSFTSMFHTMKIDSIICSLRKNFGVEFLQNDMTDDLVKDPSVLLTLADSLRDTSNIKDAEQNYGALVNNFPLSPEGKKAFIELAKIQTEKQQYHQAIRNYRNFLITNKDSEKRCNTFFMIGFIYDEYLNMSQQAEVNYKWILKNARGCELADDAEFMLLHLDEPMNSVEELQAEAIRQGRKLELSTEANN